MSVQKVVSSESLRAVDVGCDWLSYTAAPLTSVSRETLVVIQRAIDFLQSERECVPRPRNMQGYEMMCYPHFMAGRNDEGRIRVQATSWFADQHLRHLEGLQGINVSRIDLQATVLLDDTSLRLARALYEAIPLAQAHLSRKHKLTYIEGSDGGSTLYIGAPSSARRIRVYDKHAEDPTNWPKGAWRIEVQYRDEVAEECYNRFAVGWETPVPDVSLGMVQAQLDAWHVPLEITREPGSSVKVGLVSEPHSVIRKLAWLETDVAAACRNLASDGFADEVYSLLVKIADEVYTISSSVPKLGHSSERWLRDESVSD